MIETLRFQLDPEGIDLCEFAHTRILKEMFNNQNIPFDWSKKEEILFHFRNLIRVVFQPYDKEYNVYVSGSHIAIDRTKDCSFLPEKHYGVVGVTHIET